jgi:hypothetical protein
MGACAAAIISPSSVVLLPDPLQETQLILWQHSLASLSDIVRGP